jgi:Xaa-Pro aminopeptidase
VLVPSGVPVPIAGTDQVHDFHAHAEHYYLAGSAGPGSVLAFDETDGWRLFARTSSIEELVWTNAPPAPEALARTTGLDRVDPIENLVPWLERRRGEPVAVIGNRDLLDHPGRYRLEGFSRLEIDIDEETSARLGDAVSELRRAKDVDELALMRAAAEASVAGHLHAIRNAREGWTERAYQVEIEAEMFRNGGDRTAYGSIVGAGSNGAVLHFGPGSREFRNGQIVLCDAAAEVAGYAADVTRTFPVGPRFEGIQADLYDLVYGTQQEAISAAAPGVEYRDLHLAASRSIAAGLVDLGLLRGNPDALVDADAHALFFPHGLGHMLGLATHDAGGCLAGREPSDRFGLKYLRADLPLQPNYVVTIEPGIYFIPALLNDPERRERYGDMVNWEMAERLIEFGGIRIEDDVLITPSGAQVLSGGLPGERSGIEALRQEGLAS